MESDYKDSYKYCCSDSELARLQSFDAHENDEVTRRFFKEKEERYRDNVYKGPIDKYKITKEKWLELQNTDNKTI